MLFFRSLLNAKPHVLDPDIPKKRPQQPTASALGTEPKEEEVATAMKATTNAKAVGPDGLPVELLKFGRQQDRTVLIEVQQLITNIWCKGKNPQQWKDAVITVWSTRRTTRQSAQATVVSRSCSTRVRCL